MVWIIRTLMITALICLAGQPARAQDPEEASYSVSTITERQARHLKLGKVALANKEYDAAITHFSKAISLKPNATAYHGRARACYEKGKLRSALIDAGKVVKLQPKNSAAHSLMGKVYFQREQYDFAIRKFNQAVKLDKSNSEARRLRTQAYKNKVRRKSASHSFSSLKGKGTKPDGDDSEVVSDFEKSASSASNAVLKKLGINDVNNLGSKTMNRLNLLEKEMK